MAVSAYMTHRLLFGNGAFCDRLVVFHLYRRKYQRMDERVHVWCHQNGRLCELCPSFTSERTFGQYVSNLLGGYQDPGLSDQIPNPDSHDEFGRYVSWTGSSLVWYFDHPIVVFKNEKRCPLAGDVRVWRNTVCYPFVRHE